ncbi:MAG: hypothetical protein KBA71_16295 [Opitutaceae bacterium]|nr:hypothetical protein [Opitutaceae bacterium]
MSTPSLATEAWVLFKKPPAETFQTFVVFSAEHGHLTVLKRLSRKSAGTQPAIDLFDEVSLLLENRNQGPSWFVREVRLLTRFAAIGRNYDALRLASAFATLVCRNQVGHDSRAKLYALLRTSLAAFASAAPPGVVYFKSVYCFVRDEGYPIKQQWLPSLPQALHDQAVALLKSTLADLPGNAGNHPDLLELQDRLNDFLRGHTDVLVD